MILDADAIIKLNRAGVLSVLVKAHDCLVTQTVYEEVVVAGRAKGYVDADPIDSILQGSTRIAAEARTEEIGLGRGELSILVAMQARSEATVVTDDEQFRATLARRGHSGLTSVDAILLLVRGGWLKTLEGLESLDRMKSSVQEDSYLEAREELLRL